MPAKWILQLTVCATLPLGLLGCRACCDQECCPTDARAIVCAPGEEAVRRAPCGPDLMFHGHKPTCWGVWPAGWDIYHAERCPTECTACQLVTPASLEPELPEQLQQPVERVPSPPPAANPPKTPPTRALGKRHVLGTEVHLNNAPNPDGDQPGDGVVVTPPSQDSLIPVLQGSLLDGKLSSWRSAEVPAPNRRAAHRSPSREVVRPEFIR